MPKILPSAPSRENFVRGETLLCVVTTLKLYESQTADSTWWSSDSLIVELFLEEQTSNWQRKISEWERKINSSNIQGSWWFQAVPGNRIKGDYFYAVVQQSHWHWGRKNDTQDSLNLLSSVIFFTSEFMMLLGECGYYVYSQMVWRYEVRNLCSLVYDCDARVTCWR